MASSGPNHTPSIDRHDRPTRKICTASPTSKSATSPTDSAEPPRPDADLIDMALCRRHRLLACAALPVGRPSFATSSRPRGCSTTSSSSSWMAPRPPPPPRPPSPSRRRAAPPPLPPLHHCFCRRRYLRPCVRPRCPPSPRFASLLRRRVLLLDIFTLYGTKQSFQAKVVSICSASSFALSSPYSLSTILSAN